jgi:hypothetical protein
MVHSPGALLLHFVSGKSDQVHWPIHWLTFALDPENLLIGHGLSEPLEDAELLLHMCIAHNLELFRQCEFVYSRDVLEDMEIVKTRRAAALFLRKLDHGPPGVRGGSLRSGEPPPLERRRNRDHRSVQPMGLRETLGSGALG